MSVTMSQEMDGSDPLQVPSLDTSKGMTRMTSVPVVVEDNHEVSPGLCVMYSVFPVAVIMVTPLSPSPSPPPNRHLCYHCHGNRHYHCHLCHHYHLIAIIVITTISVCSYCRRHQIDVKRSISSEPIEGAPYGLLLKNEVMVGIISTCTECTAHTAHTTL